MAEKNDTKAKAPKSKADAEQELQKKYMELQMLKQQLGTIAQQKQMVDERQAELQVTIEALKNMDKIKGGSEIWSSLGSGTFVKSDISDTENVLVAVGAGVVVSEKIDKAATILESRIADMDAVSSVKSAISDERVLSEVFEKAINRLIDRP